jgi:hypothetical protein
MWGMTCQALSVRPCRHGGALRGAFLHEGAERRHATTRAHQDERRLRRGQPQHAFCDPHCQLCAQGRGPARYLLATSYDAMA